MTDATQRLVLVVVGARLEAEVEDRPIAHDVARRMGDLFDAAVAGPPGTVLVTPVTDLWYMHQESLRSLPVVSIGPPEHNALTAWLADKLPSVAAAEGQWVVQMRDGAAACWGTRRAGTARAARILLDDWADDFVDQAVRALSR